MESVLMLVVKSTCMLRVKNVKKDILSVNKGTALTQIV